MDKPTKHSLRDSERIPNQPAVFAICQVIPRNMTCHRKKCVQYEFAKWAW
jgi:hypothetical protein